MAMAAARITATVFAVVTIQIRLVSCAPAHATGRACTGIGACYDECDVMLDAVRSVPVSLAVVIDVSRIVTEGIRCPPSPRR